MNMICQQCHKDAGIEKSGNNGKDAALAQNAGFIVKFLILYGIDQWIIVCSKDCYQLVRDRLFAEHNVTAETKAEAKEFLDEQKAKIPQMAKETCDFMAKVQRVLKGKR